MSKVQRGEFEIYALTIMGSQRISQTFGSLAELKEAVSGYLTPGEIRGGVLERLTTFSLDRLNKDHYVENKWQNFTACAYPKED